MSAYLSPSKLEALETCPCYGYGSDQKDSEDPKDPRVMGTRLHRVMEDGDTSLCLDEEELHWIEWTQEKVDGLREGLIPGDFVEFPELDLGGAKADKVFLIAPGGGDPVSAIVIDYKFGRKSVTPAEANIQGWSYLALVMARWPTIQNGVSVFIAPLTRDFSQASFERSWLKEYDARVAKITAEFDDPFKQPRNTDPDLCSGCAHKGRCPAWTQLQLSVVDHLCPTEAISARDIFDMTRPPSIEIRRVRQGLSDFFDKWRKEVRADNLDAVQTLGIEIPGYALARRSGKTSIPETLSFSTWNRLQTAIQLPEFLTSCSVDFKKLIDVYAEETKLSLPDAKTTLLAILDGLVTPAPPSTVYLMRSKRGKRGADKQLGE